MACGLFAIAIVTAATRYRMQNVSSVLVIYQRSTIAKFSDEKGSFGAISDYAVEQEHSCMVLKPQINSFRQQNDKVQELPIYLNQLCISSKQKLYNVKCSMSLEYQKIRRDHLPPEDTRLYLLDAILHLQ